MLTDIPLKRNVLTVLNGSALYKQFVNGWMLAVLHYIVPDKNQQIKQMIDTSR